MTPNHSGGSATALRPPATSSDSSALDVVGSRSARAPAPAASAPPARRAPGDLRAPGSGGRPSGVRAAAGPAPDRGSRRRAGRPGRAPPGVAPRASRRPRRRRAVRPCARARRPGLGDAEGPAGDEAGEEPEARVGVPRLGRGHDRGTTASTSSPSARTTSGSSERVWTMADWIALRRLSPSATSSPAEISDPGRGHLLQRRPLQVSDRLADLDEHLGGLEVDAGFVGDHLGLDVGGVEVELDGHETLTGRLLQVLENALVAGVVGDHQLEPGRRLQRDAEPVDGELAAMVGERVDDHRGVLAGLHDLVQITDGALAHGPGQRPVHPGRLPALQQVAPHQIGRGQVLVTRHGDQIPAQLVGHRLHEAGLPAARRALQQHRQAAARRGAEHLHLVAHRAVVRSFRGSASGLLPRSSSHSARSKGTIFGSSSLREGPPGRPGRWRRRSYPGRWEGPDAGRAAPSLRRRCPS